MSIISTGLLSAEHSSRLPEYITLVHYSAVKGTLKYFWEAEAFLPGFQITEAVVLGSWNKQACSGTVPEPFRI